MYTLLAFLASVAIYALVGLLSDSRSTQPIGSQFRNYVHAWRTLGPLEPDTAEDFSYKDETVNRTGWGAVIFRHRWLPLQTIETDLSWVALIVFSAATLLTHNTAVFFILAVNIFVIGLMLFQRLIKSGFQPAFYAPSFSNWAKAQIGIFLLWSPWLLVLIKQASQVDQEFWIPKPEWDTVVQVLESFLNPSLTYLPDNEVMVMRILFTLVLCLGLVHYRKRMSRFVFLAALFTLPILGELIVSIRSPIFLDRTLIWTTIPLFLVLAAGIVQLRFRVAMIVVLAILATMSVFSASDYFRFYRKEDWSTAAGYVANFAQKDDLILFNSALVQIPFDYYFHPYEIKYLIEVEKRGVPDMFDRGIPEPRMTQSDLAELTSLLSGHNRVWLVYSHDSYTDPNGLVPQVLASKMKCIQQRDFYGGQVQLYETP